MYLNDIYQLDRWSQLMKEYNNTTYAILGILTTGCKSGYAIKQLMDQSLTHFWKISYGQIYPTMKQLTANELVTVTNTQQDGKPDRKEYDLTQKGKDALKHWLSQPIEQIPVERNEVLLKLFFGKHQTTEQTVKLLEDYKRKLEERLQTYHTIAHSIQTHHESDPNAQYWLFTLDYGKRTTMLHRLVPGNDRSYLKEETKMSKGIFSGRFTTKNEEDLVVFIIGMRINKRWAVHKWFPVFIAMPSMIRELYTNKEELGFLSMESFFGLRTTVMIQYWRSTEDLLSYAKGSNHLKARKNFNQKVGDHTAVGIYHETYIIKKGQYESIYGNMPQYGLAKAMEHIPVRSDKRSARKRLTQ